MKNKTNKKLIPNAAYVPTLNKDNTFDFEAYLGNLEKTEKEIESQYGVRAALQYYKQETFKVRYNVAQELSTRQGAKALGTKRSDKLAELVDFYNKYLVENQDVLPEAKDQRVFPEPNYDLLAESPVYGYESDLNLSLDDKKDMMKKVVQYLRERDIYVVFKKTITDEYANDSKIGYIDLDEDGKRDLPIGELMGNVILINVWNVDFMSSFLTIGHLYGHMVQEMHIEEIRGIREFLEYEKPLNMQIVQSRYRSRYGRKDYRSDFKVFEEEAFAYAKYTFQEAGIKWNEKIEHAMRVYIETDFAELWRWATEAPEKESKDFNVLFEKNYKLLKGKFNELYAKKVGVVVTGKNYDNVRVVRDGEL